MKALWRSFKRSKSSSCSTLGAQVNVLSFVWGWSGSKDWSMWDRGGDGRDLGKSEGRGDVVLHELFYRSTAKNNNKRWDVVHTNPSLPTSIQLNFKRLSHFEV